MGSVEDYVEQLRAGEVERPPGTLPPHYPTCFGCGPQAQAGLHLRVRLEGEEVVADYTFGDVHSGAPGIAHGGTVAALVDDLLGYALYLVREPGVTRRLEVDYLRPVLVGTPYQVRGRVDRREGRKVFCSCEGVAPDGTVAFRATGLFVVVPLSHFAVGQESGDGQGPVAL
jgi:acyl-coenzyme A thioesterase PaaI-like protein